MTKKRDFPAWLKLRGALEEAAEEVRAKPDGEVGKLSVSCRCEFTDGDAIEEEWTLEALLREAAAELATQAHRANALRRPVDTGRTR